MTVTLILRLDSEEAKRGHLSGWAELVPGNTRLTIEGPESIVAAARLAVESSTAPTSEERP